MRNRLFVIEKSELSKREKMEYVQTALADSATSISAEVISPKEIQELIHQLQVHQIELETQNDELLISRDELKNAKEHYFDLYDKAPIGYCSLDKDGLILEANRAAAKMLGWSRHFLDKKSITDFIVNEDQDVCYFCRTRIFHSKEGASYELRMKNGESSNFWAHLSATSETHINGFPYIRLAIIDISENKKAQEEIKNLNHSLKKKVSSQLQELRQKDVILTRQSNLAQMGEMISMIAHQWRQPLNAISGTAVELSLLNMQGKTSARGIAKSAQYVQDVAQSMSQTIDDFMNFNKETDNDFFSLLGAALKTYSIVKPQFKSRYISVNMDIDENIKVFHNKMAFEHSLLNLLLNSRDAFEERPKIENREIDVYSKEDANFVYLIVKDNAGGIDEDVVGKIFNPYFTTKEQGKGTGLGLYMAKRVLENVDSAAISVESQNSTTTFTIRFAK